MKKLFLLLLLFTTLLSCKKASRESIMQVNYYTENCRGVFDRICLLVQRDKNIGSDQWEYFYENIRGFEYEEGYVYKLRVKTEKIDNPPQDAASLRYVLIEVISKVKH